MIIQISSGQGPQECQLAVGKLYEALKKEFPDIKLLSKKEGDGKGCFDSIRFSTENEKALALEGSIQWICQSPFRPHHKRKNWFVDVSVIPEKNEISQDKDYLIEKFHSGGKGGQNVNKVETGVRIIHVPTGISVTCTEERSQYMNKQKAMQRIREQLAQMQKQEDEKQVNAAWREHNRIVRGNPVRVYRGMEFAREKYPDKEIDEMKKS